MLSDAVKSQLNIIDYARDIGLTPYRISSRYYSIKEMDSIRINMENGLWYRNSMVGSRSDVNTRGQAGGSVIDFAAYFDRESFVPDGVRSHTVGGAAMIALAERYKIVDDGRYRVFTNHSNRFGQKVNPRPDTPVSLTHTEEIKAAKMGILEVEKDLSSNERVIDYLTRVRGISNSVVQRFIDEDMLYQSKPNKHGFSNCVFVSQNNRFACEHGATEGGRFVRTLPGSDMNELFFYNPAIKEEDDKREKTLVITESVIDMMSVMTQFEREGRDIQDYKFLALAGTTNLGTLEDPKGLEYHLRMPENSNITNVLLALDTDDAGLRCVEHAQEILQQSFNFVDVEVAKANPDLSFAGTIQTYLPPQGKDWNDYIKLNEPPIQIQEQNQPLQTTLGDRELTPEILLSFSGTYADIHAMSDEFTQKQEEWIGGFSHYIHPYSDMDNTVMSCEVYDGEYYAEELLKIAEKYNVVVDVIDREELERRFNEEAKINLDEERLQEMHDNPMELEQPVQEEPVEEQEPVAEVQQSADEPVIEQPIQKEQEPVAEVQQKRQRKEKSKKVKPYVGIVYVSGTDWKNETAEATFIMNEGVTSRDVLNLIEYNTGFYEEVVNGLKQLGTYVVFNEGDANKTTDAQQEYDAIVQEGRATFELYVDDLDEGSYSLTVINDEKGGVPFGERARNENYTVTNGTITYEAAVSGTFDLQVGDIIAYTPRSEFHEVTITKITNDRIEMSDNHVPNKTYSIKSYSRGHKDKEWGEILEESHYAVIARANDSYAVRTQVSHGDTAEPTVEQPIQEEQESVAELERNIDESVVEQPVQAEQEPVAEVEQNIAEPTVEQPVQEEQEPVAEVEQNIAEPAIEQPVQEEQESDIVVTNTTLYTDAELTSMRENADLSLQEIDYRDKSIPIEERMEIALSNGLKQVLDTEGFKNWLSTQSTGAFSSLSIRNSFRVFAQNPTAKYIASYDRWHYFGRQVKQGAEAIGILRPVIPNEGQIIKKAKEIYINLKEQIRNGAEKASVSLYRNSTVSFSMNRQGAMDVSISGKGVKMLPDYASLELFIKKKLQESPVKYNKVSYFDIRDTIVPETLWIRKDSGDYTEQEIVLNKDGKPNIRTQYGVTRIEIINTPERQARFTPDLECKILPHDTKKMEVLLDVCLMLSEKLHNVPVYQRTVAEDKILSDAKGYYHRDFTDEQPNGYIVINADMEISEKCATLLHEITHSELHRDLDKLQEEMGDTKINTAMVEVQAEAVAYSVAQRFGLETDTSSFKYLAAFSSGFDMVQLTESMNVILKESEKLTKELTTILDEKGYNLDLSEKSVVIDVKAISTEYMELATLAREKCSAALAELPNMMNEYSKDSDIVSTLREQYKAYTSQLAIVNHVYDHVEMLNNAKTSQDRESIVSQLKEFKTSISVSQKTCKELDTKFIEQADKVKGQLRVDFEKDSLATLKEMSKTYPSLALLSDMQLKYIAESKFISSTYGRLLKTNPKLFVDKAVERATQLPLVASKNGAFVEIRRCEQFTNPPFFTNGTLCSPAVANVMFASAEQKSADFIKQAEENQEHFPTTRCEYTVFVPDNGELKFFATNIEIGSGEQNDLADNIRQYCNQPYKDILLSACQERPLARDYYVPTESKQSVVEEHSTESNKENRKIDDVVKIYTEKSEEAKSKDSTKSNGSRTETTPTKSK